MKSELAPSHIQKIGNNFVIWFEGSNSYVVLSKTNYAILNCFIESKDQQSFLHHLQNNTDVSKTEALTYYKELSAFLDDLNVKTPNVESNFHLHSIPIPNISKYYKFGDAQILINYASSKILQLINPYLQHALVTEKKELNATFDIFDRDGHLYLFKNSIFVGSYESAEFHFLQGKFAMELVNAIYNTKETDWMATFHASTVCNDQEAIMIIGASGNGKSTLSAVLMANGFDLLADDFTPMLAENQQLYRFPAAISIKEGAFSMIEDLYEGFLSEPLQVSSSKHTNVKYLPPTNAFKTSKKNFPCHKIVLVKYDLNVPSQLSECPPEKILETFIPDSWISPQIKHSKQFLNWLKDLKFYELTYSHNEYAITKFKELFAL